MSFLLSQVQLIYEWLGSFIILLENQVGWGCNMSFIYLFTFFFFRAKQQIFINERLLNQLVKQSEPVGVQYL